MEDDSKAIILNVDDNEAGRYAVTRTLRQAGFDVREASNGREALRLAEEQPDLIVLDVNLPDIGGFDVCKMIKNNPITSHIPVLHLSATYLNDESKVRGLETADGYLTQPVEPPVLIATIKALLRMKQAEKALRESEMHLKSIVESTADGILAVDNRGKVIRFNSHFTKMWRIPQELVELGDDDALLSYVFDQLADPEAFMAKVRELYGSDKEDTSIILFKDGRVFERFSSPLILEGSIVGRVWSFRDITDRRRAEKNLLDSLKREQFLGDIIRNASVAVGVGYPDGRLGMCNTAFQKLTGYSEDELRAISWNTVLTPPEWSDYEAAQLEKLHRTLMPVRYEKEYIHKSGVKIPIELVVNPFFDDQGNVSHYFAFVIDITERKRAEEALKTSEERFRELYDDAPVGYHEVNNRGIITRVNRTELEMLGYSVEEMVGQPVWNFIAEKENMREIFFGKIFGKIPPDRAYERRYLRKDGTTLPVLAGDRLLRNEKGEITGIRVTIQDITDRKKAEQEMATLQEQFRQAQKMEAIGRLAGGIAHDFNNLLTVIKGYSQLSLLDLREGDPLKANIEMIRAASDRAAELTRQLLAFSRKQILEMQVLDLNLTLQKLDKMLHRIIGEDIELVTFFTDGIGRVKADPGQIEQAVNNLAVNARDAMPEGGKLTIETANVELDEEYAHRHIAVKPGSYVMVSISDTGVGMTPEVKERIFEPFFTTKEMGKGTGLGLSTVYGIVKQSGGNIWVYSEPGQGTSFKIYLPRVDEALEEMKEEVIKEVPQGNETILVVEDEETVRKLAIQILKKQGYKVLEASEGGSALLLCEEFKEPIHLILTDVVMPRMSGRKLVGRLKEIHPEMKTLYMSGYTDNAILHHGVLEKGMNFIQKPFTVDGLVRKVREVLDK